MTNTLSDKIKPLIQTTEDGSHTLFVSEINESYHSLFGAIQESKYIFIDAALKFSGKKELSILEVGFGTGLNAFLTYVEAANRGLFVDYTTIEKFPVAFEEAIKLNYPEKVSPENRAVFNLYKLLKTLFLRRFKRILQGIITSRLTILYTLMLFHRKSNLKCGHKSYSKNCTINVILVLF